MPEKAINSKCPFEWFKTVIYKHRSYLCCKNQDDVHYLSQRVKGFATFKIALLELRFLIVANTSLVVKKNAYKEPVSYYRMEIGKIKNKKRS